MPDDRGQAVPRCKVWALPFARRAPTGSEGVRCELQRSGAPQVGDSAAGGVQKKKRCDVCLALKFVKTRGESSICAYVCSTR